MTTGLLDTAARIGDTIATLAAGTDDERGFPDDAFRLIHEAGLLAVPLPCGLGGGGLDGSAGTALELLLLLKAIGCGGMPPARR